MAPVSASFVSMLDPTTKQRPCHGCLIELGTGLGVECRQLGDS